MKRTALTIACSPRITWGLVPALAAASLIGCSQEGPNPTYAGGGSNTGGSSSTSGGSGAIATGGSSSGGTAATTGGSAGTGGMAGGCVGDPPVTPNKVCTDIATQKKGDMAFTVSSPDFTFCGEIPKAMTCDGNDFGTGTSPQISWTAAPAGTLSFAVVFKDLSLSNDVATERLGYHWAMWDIPASSTGLPAGMTGGYASTEVPGAHQWSSLTSYGFFTPCPNPFPKDDARFACSLTQDSYSITVYALKVAKLDNLPPSIETRTNMPPTGSWNWVVNMGHYLESLDAVAVAEYRGTSKAWAKAFVSPAAPARPCSGSAGGSGGTSAGGASAGGGTSAGGSTSAGGASVGGASVGGASAGGSTSAGGASAGGSGGIAMCLK